MKRLIRAAVVVVGMGVALPALGGDLPLLIVAADFDALLAEPSPPPAKTAPAKIKPRSSPAATKTAAATALPGTALAMREPRAMK